MYVCMEERSIRTQILRKQEEWKCWFLQTEWRLLFLDSRYEQGVAVRFFALLFTIFLVILQKFIQQVRRFRFYPCIFIQRLVLRFGVQLVIWSLWELQDLGLRVYTLGLQLRDQSWGGQRHRQGHVHQRWPGQGCRPRTKLDPRAGHGRYGGEGLGPGEIGQTRVWKLHLRQGGRCRGHWYGLDRRVKCYRWSQRN